MLLSMLLVAGCASTQAPVSRAPQAPGPTYTPVPTPTAFPTYTRDPIYDFRPPAATIEVAGSRQTAGIGGYSWRLGNSGIHADGAGPITPKQPLEVPREPRLTLRLPLDEAPVRVAMSIAQVTEADGIELAHNREWTKPISWDTELLPQREQPIELELEPGLHVLSINAAWDDMRSVAYGFLLEAR